MVGDSLARGAKSATFGPPKISQEAWDKIWEQDAEPSWDCHSQHPEGQHLANCNIISKKK